MGVREIWEKIINRIRRPKQQLLTGNVEPRYNKAQAFRGGYKESVTFEEQTTQESLEDCILEYICQYRKQIETGENKDLSYKAFTRMFYEGQEEIGENVENQEKLRRKIHKNKKYRIDGQYSSKGKPIFYHISQNTPEGQKISDKDKDMYKIYLNCERKNISRLTGEILKSLDEISDCAFRMKFVAESDESEISKRYQRNDKIVLYTSGEIDKERIINCLIELKRQRPELFSSRKKLPLMPKVNGFIGCIKQGGNAVTTPLYQNKYADTYNSKLATIMEDCMIVSLREVSARDEGIFDAMEGYFGEDPEKYLNAFKMMNPEQIRQVVQIFKTQLIEYCEKSNVPIDIETEKPNQQR